MDLPSQPDAFTRRKEFLTGARDTAPLLLGAAPFGLIYGTLAVASGLSAAAAMDMSIMVFAGSAQFIAVGLLAVGTPVLDPVIGRCGLAALRARAHGWIKV